jgi:hypothetical protein
MAGAVNACRECGASLDEGHRFYCQGCINRERERTEDISLNVDDIARGLITAALWADCMPLEEDGEIGGGEDLEMCEEGKLAARALCLAFVLAHLDDCATWCENFDSSDGDSAEAFLGHTLYLSAAGHGVSFDDRTYGMGDDIVSLGRRLDDAARSELGQLEHTAPYDRGDGTADWMMPLRTS